MVEATVEAQPTKDELLAQMNEAIASGNFKLVTQLSRQITKVADTEDKAELEAKQLAVKEKTEVVLSAIMKPLAKLYEAGELDSADGVWFTWDFEENLKTCKLLKKAVTTHKGGGGGAGKRFSVGTEELLSKHGGELVGETGKTYQELWDESTEKNHRYQVRMKLLKLDGVSQ